MEREVLERRKSNDELNFLRYNLYNFKGVEPKVLFLLAQPLTYT
ncbi:hypothetical protein [Enterococcus sp. UD-01]